MAAYQRINILQWSDQWICSGGSYISCICKTLAWPVWPFGVWLGSLLFYIPISISVEWGTSGLMCLGLGRSKDPSWRMQIHLIQRLWLYHGRVLSSWWCQTSFFVPTMWRNIGRYYCLPVVVWPWFFFVKYVGKKVVPLVPFSRLLVHSGFGYYFGCVKDDNSNNIQEVISLVIVLIWNYTAVYGGSMVLNIYFRDLFKMWKSLKSDSAMIFSSPLICWDYRYTLFFMGVHLNHLDTVSWISY